MTPFTPRTHYGAYLEPESGVYHGAGQSPEAFEIYRNLLGEQNTQPILTMLYTGVRGLGKRPEQFQHKLESFLNPYPTLPLMPQIGLSMTTDGTPEKHYEYRVAAGEFDEGLDRMFDTLSEAGRPFFLRIGYECNGPWNGYPPDSYREAFRHVTERLRAHGAPGATVWCVEPYGIETVMDWYPGDDVVDWWSVDWFDPDHMEKSAGFLQQADAHGKPVMIGESSPRQLGTTDPEERWDRWYRPYFETIRSSPGIKAFCYINWDWTHYPMWEHWGDARLEVSDRLTERYLEEMRCPLYRHGTSSTSPPSA